MSPSPVHCRELDPKGPRPPTVFRCIQGPRIETHVPCPESHHQDLVLLLGE